MVGEFKGDGVTDSLEVGGSGPDRLDLNTQIMMMRQGLSATETKAVKDWQDFYEKHEVGLRARHATCNASVMSTPRARLTVGWAFSQEPTTTSRDKPLKVHPVRPNSTLTAN